MWKWKLEGAAIMKITSSLHWKFIDLITLQKIKYKTGMHCDRNYKNISFLERKDGIVLGYWANG